MDKEQAASLNNTRRHLTGGRMSRKEIAKRHQWKAEIDRRLEVKEKYLQLFMQPKYSGKTLREAMPDIFQAHYEVYIDRRNKGVLDDFDREDIRLALLREEAGVVKHSARMEVENA